MTARAIWKGTLKLDSTRVPVKLYSAVQDQTVRFHILDDRSKMRVKQHMVNADTGKEVPAEEIQKGYEIEPGTFVILDDEELKALQPEASRDIEIKKFVPTKAIPPEFYDRPYYIGPDGDVEAYFALAEALSNQKKEGIATWVMRNQPYTGALGAVGDHLLLFTLRNAEEVLSAKDLPRPTGRAPDKRELNMAKQLIEMLKGEFKPEDFKDEYRERVREFIEQKAKGKAPRLRAVKTKRAPSSLDAVLAKSIASLKKGKRAA
jgi:DNA end-binding protein Ku